jgi:hypothetical protein
LIGPSRCPHGDALVAARRPLRLRMLPPLIARRDGSGDAGGQKGGKSGSYNIRVLYIVLYQYGSFFDSLITI